MQGRRNWLYVQQDLWSNFCCCGWGWIDQALIQAIRVITVGIWGEEEWGLSSDFLRFWWFSSVSMKCNSACCEEFWFICRRGNISKLCIEVESKSVMWRLAVTISCANRSSRAWRGFRDHLTLNVVLTSWVEGCKVECVRKPTLGGLHWCVIGG